MSRKNVAEANEMLMGIQSAKHHMVQGQAGCPTKESQRTAKAPSLQPCFNLRYGDSKADRIETEDYEIMVIEAINPYNNVSLEDLTIVSLTLRYLFDGAEVDVPIAQYTNERLADLTPSKMINFGLLGPNESSSREIVLGTFRTAPGDYLIKLECSYSVRFEQGGEDVFVIPVGLS